MTGPPFTASSPSADERRAPPPASSPTRDTTIHDSSSRSSPAPYHNAQPPDDSAPAKDQDFERGPRFWIIIAGLCITSLLASLEHTVVTTAAPHILEELDLRENFVWITNAFFVCSAALTPLFGQLCNIFGRRWVFLTIVAFFTLGSGICGGATTGSMLIAGRAIQGAGSGGIVLTVNIIVSDLCPLRKRGLYMSIILSIFGVGVALGPFIGGTIAEHTTWRWVFWINLPVGGLSMVLMFLFLRVEYDRETAVSEKLRRIDFIGNGILMAGTVAILYALTYAGTRYLWSSWHTLVPLLLGFLGFAIFAAYEVSGIPSEPVMPVRLFAHRTSIVVLVNTFLNSLVYFWYLYFLPVYFQAVCLYSPGRAGYSLLPQAIAGAPGAIVAASSLSRWGKFKPIHFVGFCICTLGIGLLALLDRGSSIADWATFQIITALGIGIIIDTLLPAFQAPVAEKDQAAATSTWGFIRAFGSIWGVAIPAVVFNNRINDNLQTISDPVARAALSHGGAYEQASASFIRQFPLHVQDELRAVYTSALKRCFWVGAIFSGIAILLVLIEKEVPLRKQLDTEYRLEKKRQLQTEKAADGEKVEAV